MIVVFESIWSFDCFSWLIIVGNKLILLLLCFSPEKWELVDELTSLLIHHMSKHYPCPFVVSGHDQTIFANSWFTTMYVDVDTQNFITFTFALVINEWLQCRTPIVLFSFIFRYLTELLGERHILGPFMAVLPHCYRLINQGKIRFSKQRWISHSPHLLIL